MLARLLFLVLIMIATPAAARPLDWSALPLPKLEGGAFAPDAFAGKVVLVVNTASFCGFTKQYSGLEALWARHRDGGFVLLGVPSNDFGAQEPGSSGEIKEFCETTFGIDFPMLAKQAVVGADAHPLYRWAAQQDAAAVPKWNFHKLLIGRDGTLLASFPSAAEPTGPEVTEAVDAALAR
ncbi:glutathione peroxidase [Inquilinus limosus]|uniref:Glutathione peroxidase n=1 Tax=Inquilinus limosus TaxID=171674 RepID=A0A211ZKL1_9PROT|nr:glutathione peroxidase [Inquilinus limosus]OWJ65811.1 glutathione peroxidase [Inquilinus limosus]